MFVWSLAFVRKKPSSKLCGIIIICLKKSNKVLRWSMSDALQEVKVDHEVNIRPVTRIARPYPNNTRLAYIFGVLVRFVLVKPKKELEFRR